MKTLGIVVCVVGTLIALLFIPCSFLGVKGWYFTFGNAGMGIKNYQLLDTGLLVVELLIINGIGLALFFLGKKKEKK